MYFNKIQNSYQKLYSDNNKLRRKLLIDTEEKDFKLTNMACPISSFTRHLLLNVGLSIMEAVWVRRQNEDEVEEENAGVKSRLFYQLVILMTLSFLKMGLFLKNKLYTQ